MSLYSALGSGECGGIISPEQAREIARAAHAATIDSAQRTAAHITRRIEYETAVLEAAGGCPEVLAPERKKAVQPKGPASVGGVACQMLGAAGFWQGFRNSGPPDVWRLIVKVNRSTVEILTKETTTAGVRYYIRKNEAWEIAALKTPEQVRAEFPEMLADWQAVLEIRRRNEERRAARALQTTLAPVLDSVAA